MRPVNLIPPEDRRGDKAPLRTGAFAYVLVSGLGLLLLAVVVTALTSKQISDREAKKQTLEQELADVTVQAESLRAFSDFRTVQQNRTATVTSLAQSRFDWERVMNELALILPDDIWLVNLTGTVSPAVQVKNSAEVTTRDSVAGPALELIGCAPSQDAVAAFIAALEDIDGVTRVGVKAAERPEQQDDGEPAAASAGGGASDAVGDDCRTTDEIVKFEIVVAFDAVPTPAAATAAPSAPAPVAPSGDGAQLADTQTEQAVQRSSTKEQTAKAEQAQENLIPGG
jgi:Tfp pilus assembly protein PilN